MMIVAGLDRLKLASAAESNSSARCTWGAAFPLCLASRPARILRCKAGSVATNRVNQGDERELCGGCGQTSGDPAVSERLVDSDDVVNRMKQQQPVDLVYPDQGADELGCFIVPNAAVLIAGAPHPEAGKRTSSGRGSRAL
jgi:hypothetical protein